MTPATAPTGSSVPSGHKLFYVPANRFTLRLGHPEFESKKQVSLSFHEFARFVGATSMGWSQQALASAAVRDSQSVVQFDCAGVVSGLAGDYADWVPAYCSAPATL